jgi:hypothetical protein
MHEVSNARYMEIYAAGPLVTESSLFEADVAIAKMKRYTSPGIHKIAVEFIQTGGEA